MDDNVEALEVQYSLRRGIDGNGRGVRGSYALYVTLGLGSASETSQGGRNVRAIATAPGPMPNEPI